MSIARQIDKICDEFEASFRAGRPQKLSDVLETSPQELRAELLLRLIEVEVELRLAGGQSVKTADYTEYGDTAIQHAAKVLSQLAETITTIGPYKLKEKLGEGGMGIVFMAEQKEPLRRKVALKLIRVGMDGPEILARFEQEREALSLMDHENIAKVLDAGTTEHGRPYFVMELVKGIPLTKYCDSHRLSIDERLRLFLQTCNAIHHAHQKSVIHRDIKPSNVLVTLHDGKPLVKVIDFGLAKAIQGRRLGDRSLKTEFKQVMGTLQYMSPEQAEMNALDVDTRSDVYSLGILLYELLTGSTPIQKDTAEKLALDRVLLAIREDEAPRPSLRLNSLGESATSISDLRRMDSIRLSLILRGDLDWIVMKALEKDRTRRYDSASAFAKDVGNFLSGDVVTARPPSLKYQLQKYVRRHRGLVVSTIAIVVMLVLAIAATSWGMYRASAEALRAEENHLRVEKTLARSDLLLANARWNDHRAVETRSLLQRIPRKYREFEWGLLSRRCEGGFRTLYGHTQAVNSVAWSPDGESIVSASCDGSVHIWNPRRSAPVGRFNLNKGWVNSAVFSNHDGKWILTANNQNTVQLIDVSTGTEIREFVGHSAAVMVAIFNDDNTQVLSGSEDGLIKLWDTDSGKQLREFRGHEAPVRSLALRADTATLVSGSQDGSIRLWSLETGHETKVIKGHDNWVTSVCFSPDGKYIASGSFDKTVRLWDSATGQPLRVLEGHTEWIDSVAFSTTGSEIASGSRDNTIRIWDVESGHQKKLLSGHLSAVYGLSYDRHSSQLASASLDGTIKLWDLKNEPGCTIFRGHFGAVNCIAFDPMQDHIASGGSDGTIRIWDLTTGHELNTLQPFSHSTTALEYSKDGNRIASGYANGGVLLWTADSTRQPQGLQGHTKRIGTLAFSNDSRWIATGSDDQTIIVWDAVDGTPLEKLVGHTQEVTSVAFGLDGRRLFSSGRDGSIRVWDWKRNLLLANLGAQNAPIHCMALCQDGSRLYSGGYDGVIRAWDTVTEKRKSILRSDASFDCIAVSTSGSRFATNDLANAVVVWDCETGDELLRLTGHDDLVRDVVFNADGTRLASAGEDGTVRVWDATPNEQLYLLSHLEEELSSVAFAFDGKTLFAKTESSQIVSWHFENDEWTKDVSPQKCSIDEFQSLTKSADGRWLAINWYYTIRLVDLHQMRSAAATER